MISASSASQKLICDSRRAVLYIDYAASLKAELIKDMLHRFVFFVCVYPDVGNCLSAESDRLADDTRDSSVARYTVNRPIWFIGKPLAVFDVRIRRVFPQYKSKDEMKLAFLIFADEQLAFSYIVLKKLSVPH